VDGSRIEPGERLVSLSLFGTVEFDFTAEPAPPEVRLVLFSIMGGHTVRVRPDQEVMLSGFTLMGSRSLDTKRPGDDEFQLPLEVTAFSLMGKVSVKRDGEETD
jgi:hypothetical protein